MALLHASLFSRRHDLLHLLLQLLDLMHIGRGRALFLSWVQVTVHDVLGLVHQALDVETQWTLPTVVTRRTSHALLLDGKGGAC